MEDQKKTSEDFALYSQLKKDKEIKKVTNPVPYLSNVSITDVSLKARGGKEDRVFAKSSFYRKNIRRGLSFIQDGTNIQLLRRGLEKFFDLRHEAIRILKGEDERNFSLDKEERSLMKVILDEAKDIISKGGSVTVYKTEKANGENAQVAYYPQYDAWAISSKNVCALLRNEEDIKSYQNLAENRYDFAILIAQAWFNILKDKVGDKVAELKKELTGKTLIGECCGHPMHQHLVHYKEITIYFFALVDLHGQRSCLDIESAKNFIQRYNLPIVRIEKYGEYSEIKELGEGFDKLFREVSENPIEVDHEGAVLYLEAKTEKGPEILSLCKLKTLEYRIYRKLREKMKNLIARFGDPTSAQQSFVKEVKELCQTYTPPKPLDYYFELAKTAFNFMYNNMATARRLDISHRYIDVLNVIKAAYEKHEELKESDFANLLNEPNALFGDSEGENEGADDDEEKSKPRGDDKKEETKIEEEHKNVEPTTPQRVVIISPPLYFEWDTQTKIEQKFGVKELETSWSETKPIEGTKSIAILHSLPEVTKEELKKDTFFLIAGFDKDKKESILKKLESLAEDPSKYPFTPEELKFVQSQDKSAMLDNLWSKVDAFVAGIKKLLPNNYRVLSLAKPEKILDSIESAFKNIGAKKDEPQDKKKKKEASNDNRKKVLAFVPMGIPGMGKTTFLNTFKAILAEKNIPITIVSSDQLRRECMEEYMKTHKKASEQEAFEKTGKKARSRFIDEVENAVFKTKSMSEELHVVFLDKNHPPNAIDEAINMLFQPKFSLCFHVEVAVVLPDCQTLTIKNREYPFSMSFLLTSLIRCITRKNHETLIGDEVKIASVVMCFFNSYKNFKPKPEKFRHLGARYIMKIPFTPEGLEVEKKIPDDVYDQVEKVLTSIKGFDADEEEVKILLHVLKSNNVNLGNPDPEVLMKKTREGLDACLALFNPQNSNK